MPRMRTPQIATERHPIRHHTEECDCDHCGYPLYVGDTAIVPRVAEPFARAYCSTACAIAELAGDDPRDTIRRHH